MCVCMVIYVRATAYSLDCHVGSTDRAAELRLRFIGYLIVTHLMVTHLQALLTVREISTSSGGL